MREACRAANLGLDCRIESSIGGSIFVVSWGQMGGKGGFGGGADLEVLWRRG